MYFKTVTATALAVLMTAPAAQASNEAILLNPDDLSQHASISIDGDFNRLSLNQTSSEPGAGNTASITIEGSYNGGPEGTSFSGDLVRLGLQPGTLLQDGFGNNIEMDVQGDRNLFAMVQDGNNNNINGSVVGFDNQVAVMQTGNNNFVSFSQNGTGNMISVSQTNW